MPARNMVVINREYVVSNHKIKIDVVYYAQTVQLQTYLLCAFGELL